MFGSFRELFDDSIKIKILDDFSHMVTVLMIVDTEVVKTFHNAHLTSKIRCGRTSHLVGRI